MIKYTDQFKFNNNEVVLGDLELIDYDTVKRKSTGDYYKLSREASKVLFGNIGLKNRQFSKTLFEVSKPTWDDLVKLKMSNKESQEFLFSCKGVIIDNVIVSIVKGNPVLDRLKATLDKYNTATNIECSFRMDELNSLTFICINKDNNVGILAHFFIESNWLDLFSVFKDETGLLNISPYKIYSNVIADDLEMVLEPSTVLGGATLALDDENIKKEYNDLLCTPVSSEELVYYMKKVLKVKLDGTKEVNIGIKAEELELDSVAISKLAYLESKLENAPEEVKNTYYSNHLKRSITMTNVTYGVLAELVWSLVDDDKCDIKYLIEIFNSLVRRKCNWFYINQ